MEAMIVRIQKARIHNLKNVEEGFIRFACNKEEDIFEPRPDVLGIYGQNGSGKTTFIDALSILQSLLSGRSLSKELGNYIMAGKERACLIFEFSMTDEFSYYRVAYEVELLKAPNLIISREKLSYSALLEHNWTKLLPIIDYQYEQTEVFKPRRKMYEITGRAKEAMDELKIARKMSQKQVTSFIFSKDTERIIKSYCVNKDYKNIVLGLAYYGIYNLCIIGNRSMGLINANLALPIRFRMEEEDQSFTESVLLKLNEPSIIPERIYEIIEEVMKALNIVLGQVIPGFSIRSVKMGSQLLKNKERAVTVELVSVRREAEVPLKYESDGIKKIISIMHMLITMYNNPSMTLAVDELDSGIFEFLLGELLKIIQRFGKGQLIFTSHNLRPLETLNRNSIIFTTSNPKNRFIRLKNGKRNINFRNLYFHDIILGGQDECIYEPTNEFAISRAFRMVGDIHEV